MHLLSWPLLLCSYLILFSLGEGKEIDCSIYQCPPFLTFDKNVVESNLWKCHEEVKALRYISTTCSGDLNIFVEEVRDVCTLLFDEKITLPLSMIHNPIDRVINITSFATMKFVKSLLAVQDPSISQSKSDQIADFCWTAVNSYKRGLFPSNQVLLSDSISITQARFYSEQYSYLVDRARSGGLLTDPESSLPHMRSDSALLEYLISIRETFDHFLNNVFLPSYQSAEVPPDIVNPTFFFQSNPTYIINIPSFYNKLVYVRPVPSETHPLMTNPLINSVHRQSNAILDADMRYRESKMLVLDDFLGLDVIHELRAYLLESTIWHDPKVRYMGSYWSEGLHHPLLLKLAQELRDLYPFIRETDKGFLGQCWFYSYNNYDDTVSTPGIGLHADGAKVNLNLWLTPDEANEMPDAGGLVIYKKETLGNETFAQVQSEQYGTEYIKGSEHLNTTVAYKHNRIVIFPSNLWHASQEMRFSRGYGNRRINLTFLFGLGSFT